MELLRDIIGRYLDSAGLSRHVQYAQLRAAWAEALGDAAGHTRLDGVRRGVATFVVDNSALLAELRGFREAELLTAVQARCPGLGIEAIRLRPGRV